MRARWFVVGLLTGAGCTDSPAEPGSADFRAAVLSSELIVDPAVVHQPPLGSWPVAAFDGSQYLVAWNDRRTKRSILYGGRIAADGTPLDELGFPILDVLPGTEHGRRYRPAVAFDGANFFVVTPVLNQIVGVRVSAAGQVLDPDGILLATAVDPAIWPPSLVFDGEQYLVAWSSGTGIHWARVKPDGTVLDPDGVLGYPLDPPRTWVGVSFDGSNFLLSWMDFDAETQSSTLDVARVAPDGTPVDESPIHVGSIAETDGLLGPVADFDGTNHVVAWTHHQIKEGGDYVRIMAGRVTPEGTTLDPNGILIFEQDTEATSVNRLDIAALDGRSTLIWSAHGSETYSNPPEHVRAAQLATDGTVSVYPQDAFARGFEATVATHAEGGLALWRRGNHLNADYPAIIGTRLDGAGMPIADSVVAPAWPASNQEMAAVAYGEQRFFVLWYDTREPSGYGNALFGVRLAADGTPLDAEPIPITSTPAHGADVVFDGANFVVSWGRSPGEGEVHTIRVSPNGDVLDLQPLRPPLEWTHSVYPRGASDETHTLLIGTSYASELAAVLLDHDGAVASEVVRILGADEGSVGYTPKVSFDGAGYLVVWPHTDWPAPSAIVGQRLSKQGALVGERFTIVDRNLSSTSGQVGGTGLHLVVWTDGPEIRATRVSSDGQVLDPDGILVTTVLWNYGSSVAFDGTDFVIAWHSPSVVGDWKTIDIHAAKLSVDGEVSPEFSISTAPELDGSPFLAGGDGRVLAAYSRFVPEPPHHARRVHARLRVHLPGLKLDVDAPGSIWDPPDIIDVLRPAGPQPSGAASGPAASGPAASGAAASLQASSPM